MKLFKQIALGGALSCMAFTAHAQEVTLRYSQWLPAGYSLQTDIIDPWFAEIERVTDGRVTVEATPKVVGTVAGQYDVVADGLADVALIVPSYSTGRFRLVDGLELPFLGDDPIAGTPASQLTYEEYIAPLNYFPEVKVLALFTGHAAHIASKGVDIRTVEDIESLRLRSPQKAVSEALEILGAVPVTKPMSEVYEMASAGIIDGGIIPADTTLSFQLGTVLDRFTLVPGGLSNTATMLAINPGTWERISAADREAILSVSGMTLARRAGEVYAAASEVAITRMPEVGMDVVELGPESTNAIRDRLQPIREQWFAVAKEAGLTHPEQMVEAFQSAYREMSGGS